MKRITLGIIVLSLMMNLCPLKVGAEVIETDDNDSSSSIIEESSFGTTDSSRTDEVESETQTSSSIEEIDEDSSDNSTQSMSESSVENGKDMNQTTDSSEIQDPDASAIVTEETNHHKGQFAMGISLRASVADVYANDSNLPGKNFIDVSSHNGIITVDEYKKIKSYGITAVAVKLTEGTTYTNELASSQIQNARAAGLTVLAYHFSRYISEQGAKMEAAYFVEAAKKFGLGTATIMVNDAEHSDLIDNGRNAHANTLAFNKQLKTLGYTNDALYVGKWWLTSGYLDTTAFGKDRVWVAQYPYTPDKNMRWNDDHGSWQWSSQMYFPGIANYQSRPFDISMSYSSYFGASGINLNNYYTINPGRVILKQDDYYYSDLEFKNKIFTIKKNTLVTVEGIEYSSTGYPRLRTDQGYISSNKNYVLQAQANIDSYFTTNPGRVILKTNDYYYSDVEFSNRTKAVAKGTIVDVIGLAYTSTGIFRLVTEDGYLTANKSAVEQYSSTIENQYYTENPGKVMLKTNDTYYTNISFTEKGAAVAKDTIVDVIDVEFTSGGIPRLKTKSGYLTANKNYVRAVVSNINDYYATNPSKVILKNPEYFYTDTDFTTKGSLINAGEMIDVLGIEFTDAGLPRLRTNKGYLTANKRYVQKVISTIDNYYTSTSGKVIMKKDDIYYNNIEFTEKGNKVTAGTVVEVIGIEYTAGGIPRFKTSNGYITTNKGYVQNLVSNYNDFYLTNPGKILVKVSDTYYNDLAFTQTGISVAKDSVVTVQSIEVSSSGVPRLKTANGYLTANKGRVMQVVSNIEDYYYTAMYKVILKVDDWFYPDLSFNTRGKKVLKDTLVDVIGIEFTESGLPRIKTEQGYLSANKNYVIKATSSLDNYYTSTTGKVKLIKDDCFYLDKSFTQKGKSVVKGTVVTVTGVEYSNSGIPRFKTTDGYLTTNKGYVQSVD